MDMQAWMNQYVDVMRNAFGERVVLIGLQGSRGRGEGREDSDIDVVMILDRMDDTDLSTYAALLDALPNRQLLCGFVAGREELANWEKYDLFQLIRDTTPYVGSLEELFATISRADVLRAVRVGAGNVYHIANHNRLHAKEPGTVAGLYKMAVFVLQAKAWLETGVYARRMADLLPLLHGEDADILRTAMALKQGTMEPDVAAMSPVLRQWAAEQLRYASINA